METMKYWNDGIHRCHELKNKDKSMKRIEYWNEMAFMEMMEYWND
jgi:hypothetical protein